MTNRSNRYFGIVFLIIPVLLSFSSCNKYSVLCPSYVVGYVEFDNIGLEDYGVGSCIVITPALRNSVAFTWCHLQSEGLEKDIYNDLCRKHNDLTYNRHRSINNPRQGDITASVIYPASDFRSISIIADKDYDENHSAGDDLGDIVRFLSWSPMKYIRSGYSEYYHYDTSVLSRTFIRVMPNFYESECFKTETESTCFPVDELVSDLEPEDLVMLGKDYPWIMGILHFEKQPAVPGEYEITVSMTTDENEVMTSSIKISL